MSRQPPAMKILQRQETVAGGLSGDGPAPEHQPTTEVPPSKAAKAAHFAGYAASALALVTSVAAAALITGRTPGASAVAQDAPPSALAGAAALRPDLLGAVVDAQSAGPTAPTMLIAPSPATGGSATTGSTTSGSTTTGSTTSGLTTTGSTTTGLTTTGSTTTGSTTTAASTSAATTPTSSERPDTANAPQASAQGISEQLDNADPPAASPLQSAEIVRQFYSMIHSNPVAALGLIEPSLFADDPSSFVSSWSAVRSVNVNRVETRPDKSMLAIVSIERSDGRWLVVKQLVRTSDITPRRIASVEILSAQLG